MQTEINTEALKLAPINVDFRFVRVTNERRNGFVEFEFAIGEPDLFVEMILAKADFEEFCAINRVRLLPPGKPEVAVDDDAEKAFGWRLADAAKKND